jgi:hypothetical protein
MNPRLPRFLARIYPLWKKDMSDSQKRGWLPGFARDQHHGGPAHSYPRHTLLGRDTSSFALRLLILPLSQDPKSALLRWQACRTGQHATLQGSGYVCLTLLIR